MNTNTDIYYGHKERKNKKTKDERIKHFVNCDNCGASISQNEKQRNQGYCDICIEILN